MLFSNPQAFRRIQILVFLLFLVNLVPLTTALADPSFSGDNFKAKWQRADKPINDGSANPARSWLWGPESFSPSGGTTEPYAESPGGSRLVQYFDKARMELNDPASGYVSNGLLVRELISAKLATGNAAFTRRQAATDIPVAGDPAGNDGPTYASFSEIASLNNDNPSPDRTGQAASATLDKAGNTGTNAGLGNKAKYVYFDQNLKHNIPDVFWNFLNQKGNVWVNGQLVADQPVLGDNPFAPWLDATGLPLTEAYWAKVTVGGQVKDVLVQAFERRLLTFTPDNPPAFQVEMGNVGRHYFTWRYTARYDLPVTVTNPGPTPASCDNLPPNKGGAFTFFKCAPAGMQLVVGAPFQPKEVVDITSVDPAGFSQTFQVLASEGDGVASFAFTTYPQGPQGLYKFLFKSETSGKEAETNVWVSAPSAERAIYPSFPRARIADLLAFGAVGFSPDEPIYINVLTPKGILCKRGLLASTSGGGGFTEILISTKSFGRWAVAGDYTMTVIAKNDRSRYAALKYTLTESNDNKQSKSAAENVIANLLWPANAGQIVEPPVPSYYACYYGNRLVGN